MTTDASATDSVWRREPIESPCVKVCVMHEPSGLCIGCKRTRAEIGDWARMTAAQRSAIMGMLAARTIPQARRGGARARRERDE